MTTSVLNYTATLPRSTAAATTANRPPAQPFARLLHLLGQTVRMTQALPDNGRISASQLARVRAMADQI